MAEAGRDDKCSVFKTYFLVVGKKKSCLLEDNTLYMASEMCLRLMVFTRNCKKIRGIFIENSYLSHNKPTTFLSN